MAFGIDTSITRTTPVGADTSPVANTTFENVAKGLTTSAETLLDIRDVGLVNEFESELGNIEEQNLAFKSLESGLTNQLIGTDDESERERTMHDLLRLHNGQVQGVLSESQAKAQQRSLLRTRISERPWLAADYRKLATLYKLDGGVGSSSSKSSPAEDFASKLTSTMLNATFFNIPKEQRPAFYANSMLESKQLDAMKAVSGSHLQAHLSNFAFSNARADLVQIRSLIEQGRGEGASGLAMKKERLQQEIELRKSRTLDAALSEAASVNASANFPTSVSRSDIEATVNAQYKVLEAAATAADPIKFMQDHDALVSAQARNQFRQTSPVFAQIMDAFPDSPADRILEMYGKSLAAIRKYNGSVEEALKGAEKNGDFNTFGLLSAITPRNPDSYSNLGQLIYGPPQDGIYGDHQRRLWSEIAGPSMTPQEADKATEVAANGIGGSKILKKLPSLTPEQAERAYRSFAVEMDDPLGFRRGLTLVNDIDETYTVQYNPESGRFGMVVVGNNGEVSSKGVAGLKTLQGVLGTPFGTAGSRFVSSVENLNSQLEARRRHNLWEDRWAIERGLTPRFNNEQSFLQYIMAAAPSRNVVVDTVWRAGEQVTRSSSSTPSFRQSQEEGVFDFEVTEDGQIR